MFRPNYSVFITKITVYLVVVSVLVVSMDYYKNGICEPVVLINVRTFLSRFLTVFLDNKRFPVLMSIYRMAELLNMRCRDSKQTKLFKI